MNILQWQCETTEEQDVKQCIVHVIQEIHSNCHIYKFNSHFILFTCFCNIYLRGRERKRERAPSHGLTLQMPVMDRAGQGPKQGTSNSVWVSSVDRDPTIQAITCCLLGCASAGRWNWWGAKTQSQVLGCGMQVSWAVAEQLGIFK